MKQKQFNWYNRLLFHIYIFKLFTLFAAIANKNITPRHFSCTLSNRNENHLLLNLHSRQKYLPSHIFPSSTDFCTYLSNALWCVFTTCAFASDTNTKWNILLFLIRYDTLFCQNISSAINNFHVFEFFTTPNIFVKKGG